jgi:hypothetical protein
VGDGGADGAVGLGRKRAEGEAPLRTEVTAALMEGGKACARAGRSRVAFIGKWSEAGEPGRAELRT